jgi:hypothetical protein
MTPKRLAIPAATLLLLLSAQAFPQNTDSSGNQKSAKEQKWNVADPHGPATDIEFETSEGTWMSLDVSPDGKSIVFDLLGDIYTMPVTGGDATLLLGGTIEDCLYE